MSGRRLASGGLIDRSRPLAFSWAGRKLSGYAGDTLASALLAAGVDVVGRGLKYHRPRGLLAAGAEEPNAIVEVGQGAGATPNLKASLVELTEGLMARPQNAWPSAEFDVLAVNGLIKPFIPAAFYYKTFKRPSWRVFAPAIRQLAGLGRAPRDPDPDVYAQRFAAVDVLVIGGGIAGLASALRASADGRSTMLVDLDFVWGGRLASSDEPVDGAPARTWITTAVETLNARKHVTMLTRTQAYAAFDHGLFGLVERAAPGSNLVRERLWSVRAKEAVIATGAIERPIVFDDGDRPGVSLADAGRLYAERFAAAPGARVAVATTSDSGHHTALALRALGVDVAVVLDARPEPTSKASAIARTRAAGVTVMSNAAPLRAIGRPALRAVTVAKLDGAGAASAAGVTLEVDALLMSGGWTPTTHLFAQAGGRLRFDDALGAFTPEGAAANVRCVGAATGVFDIEASLAGADDLKASKRLTKLGAIRSLPRVTAPGSSAAAFVDLQNDVTAGDVALAAREGYRSVEHLKRYTTLGMATDQGKTSNLAGLTLLGVETGRSPSEVGVTRFRPPYEPISLGAVAGVRIGEALKPRRRTALHTRLTERGARFEEYGVWMRPSAFQHGEEPEAAAVRREALSVANGAGVFDASPLGKIDVRGPDAAILLDRVFVRRMSSLKPGRCRYSIALNEDGSVFDDGVVARLSEDRFLVHATSGRAAAVAARLDESLQCDWPDLRAVVQDVTTAWASISLAGPKARAVASSLDLSIDLSDAALPHMGVVEGEAMGAPVRVARVSFTGERTYEISTPWTQADRLFARLFDAAAADAPTPIGVEAINALRIEKGYIHFGSETGAGVLPADLGFANVVESRNDDFIGKRSLASPAARRSGRRQLVGLERLEGDGVITPGAHLITPAAKAPCPSQGWVTSSAWGVRVDRPIALALVNDGLARLGETLHAWDDGEAFAVRVVAACAFDPAGERLHA